MKKGGCVFSYRGTCWARGYLELDGHADEAEEEEEAEHKGSSGKECEVHVP